MPVRGRKSKPTALKLIEGNCVTLPKCCSVRAFSRARVDEHACAPSRPNVSGSPRQFAVALAMGTQYKISIESLRFRSICRFGLGVAWDFIYLHGA